MSTRPHLDALLRELDPADRPDTSAELTDRARADLERILDSAGDVSPTAATMTPIDEGRRRRARTTRRTLVAAAAAGVLTVGIALPVVTQPAYAGWEAVPEPVDAPGTEAAAQDCRDFWAQGTDGRAAPEDGFPAPADLRATLTEQRGPFTFTVMRGPQGQLADCVLQDGWWTRGAGVGSMTPEPPVEPPGDDQVDTATVIDGVRPAPRTLLGIPIPGDDQTRSYAYGRAGADVTRMVLHTRAQGDVEASVQNGVWAAWWPAPEDAVEVSGTTATLILRDGTTREVSLDEVQIDWQDEG